MVTCRSIISDNVTSVPEVPRRGIWAEHGGARYALLSAVTPLSNAKDFMLIVS